MLLRVDTPASVTQYLLPCRRVYSNVYPIYWVDYSDAICACEVFYQMAACFILISFIWSCHGRLTWTNQLLDCRFPSFQSANIKGLKTSYGLNFSWTDKWGNMRKEYAWRFEEEKYAKVAARNNAFDYTKLNGSAVAITRLFIKYHQYCISAPYLCTTITAIPAT